MVLSGKVATYIVGRVLSLTGEPPPRTIATDKAVVSHVIQEWIRQSHVMFDVDWLPDEMYGRPHLRVQSLVVLPLQ